jgi:hypothetical protein
LTNSDNELCQNCDKQIPSSAKVCPECYAIRVELDSYYDPIKGLVSAPADVKSVRQRSKLLAEQLRSELTEAELTEPTDEVRARVRKVVEQCDDLRNMNLKGLALQSVLDDLFGFGPAGPLLRDPRTQNIFCIGTKPIYTEHNGHFKKTALCFESENDL